MDKYSDDLNDFELLQLEQCLQICNNLRNSLEDDEQAIHHCLDGAVFDAYSKVVRHELELVNEIRRIILTLRENAMFSGDI